MTPEQRIGIHALTRFRERVICCPLAEATEAIFQAIHTPPLMRLVSDHRKGGRFWLRYFQGEFEGQAFYCVTTPDGHFVKTVFGEAEMAVYRTHAIARRVKGVHRGSMVSTTYRWRIE